MSDGPVGLWRIDADGKHRRLLTTTPAKEGFDSSPDVSPDGRSVAFMRALDTTPGEGRSAIFVVDIGGGEPAS